MSKQVKEMLVRDYESRFGDQEDALIISLRGIDAVSNNSIRRELAGKQISVTVVKNTLAKKAFEGTGLEPLSRVLDGSSAVAYGGESVVEVARAIVDIVGRHPEMELKGAVLDGELFEGDAGVKALSKFPTRDEAIAQSVTLILSPGRNLVAQVKGPGSQIAGILKTIVDKLEKGEEIAKAG
jgi:large subunit ribosomal protein L10